jgi:hypothetical protein
MTAIAMNDRFGIQVPEIQPLPLEWMKRVMVEHARYVGDALNGPMREQFGEMMRASAHCMVAYAGKTYALVTWALEAGKQAMGYDRARGRSAGASSRAPRAFTPATKKAPGQKGPNVR